jgi:rhomboid protease GluP
MLRAPIEDEEEYAVPAWLIAVGRLLGWSEVTTRWRVVRARRRWKGAVGMLSPSRGNRRAVRHRLRDFPVVSATLVAVFCLVYARMLLARPGQGVLGWDLPTLLHFGAYFPPAIAAGQWWRLGTATLVHIGLWHLGFNAIALIQIGPSLEEIFGRGKVQFVFVLTGVAANLACYLVDYPAISAGASGGLMGLIGLAAAWGQRDGTTIGRNVRNDMIKWALYTVGFGFFVHANNLAHAGGFVAGVAFGLCFRPATLRATRDGKVGRALGGLALVALVGFLGLCLSPPHYQPPSWVQPLPAAADEGPIDQVP